MATAALVVTAVTAAALDAPAPPVNLVTGLDAERDPDDGGLLAYRGRLSWQSQGSSQWLDVAQWVIERGVWGSDVWEAWDLNSYRNQPPTDRDLGALAYGNSYAVRVWERINTIRTASSQVARIDVPMPTPVLVRLEHDPDPIPTGYGTAFRLEVHGRDLSPAMEWRPEAKPARVLVDGVELAGFHAGTHSIGGWVEPGVLTAGPHTVEVVQGNKVSNALTLLVGSPGPRLRATGHLKKRRVHLDWPAIEGADSYVIERREIGGAPGKAAAATDWETLKVIFDTGVATSGWWDRNVVSDSLYEYRVAGYAADALLEVLEPDDASTVGKRARGRSKFQLWESAWQFHLAGAAPLPSNISFMDGRRWGLATAVDGPGSQPEFLFAVDVRPKGKGVRARGVYRAVLLRDPVTAVDAAWLLATGAVLDEEVRGKCTMWFEPGNHFLLKARGLVKEAPQKGGPGKARTRAFEFEAHALFDVDARRPQCVLRMFAAKGTDKKMTVRPGDPVAFAVDVVCLGPSPLPADRVRLSADLTGGDLLLATTEGYGDFHGDIASGSIALDLGDLGPAGGKATLRERVLFVAEATEAGDELSLSLRLYELPINTDTREPHPTVEILRSSKKLEVKIAAE